MRALLSLLVLGTFHFLASGCGSDSGSDEPSSSENGSGGSGTGSTHGSGGGSGGVETGGTGAYSAGGASSGGSATGGASSGGDGGSGTGGDAGTGGDGGSATGGSSTGDWPDWVINCRSSGTECPTAFDPDTHYPAAFCSYATEEELEAQPELSVECYFYEHREDATEEEIEAAQQSRCSGEVDHSGCYPCSFRAAGSYLCSL